MRFALLIMLFTCVTGCGPLFVPMVPRLAPEEQKYMDDMWDNVLTPVRRVDHETLLDANIAYYMYVMGVDRMHMTSEKYFTGGKAVMEMDCDRANPDADQFTITVLDDRGRTLRRERYTRAEVEESSRMLRGIANISPEVLRDVQVERQADATKPTTQPATRPGTQPATEPSTARRLTPEEEKFLKESRRRIAAVAAATQPARLVSPTTGKP